MLPPPNVLLIAWRHTHRADIGIWSLPLPTYLMTTSDSPEDDVLQNELFCVIIQETLGWLSNFSNKFNFLVQLFKINLDLLTFW